MVSYKAKQDILAYQEALMEYHISFQELVKICQDIKVCEQVKKLAKLIQENQELKEYFIKYRDLPPDVLVTLPSQKLPQYKTYIIALALIYIGNFQSLRSYLR